MVVLPRPGGPHRSTDAGRATRRRPPPAGAAASPAAAVRPARPPRRAMRGRIRAASGRRSRSSAAEVKRSSGIVETLARADASPPGLAASPTCSAGPATPHQRRRPRLGAARAGRRWPSRDAPARRDRASCVRRRGAHQPWVTVGLDDSSTSWADLLDRFGDTAHDGLVGGATIAGLGPRRAPPPLAAWPDAPRVVRPPTTGAVGLVVDRLRRRDRCPGEVRWLDAELRRGRRDPRPARRRVAHPRAPARASARHPVGGHPRRGPGRCSPAWPRPCGSPAPHLASVATHPDHRGQGMAAEVTGWITARLLAEGHRWSASACTPTTTWPAGLPRLGYDLRLLLVQLRRRVDAGLGPLRRGDAASAAAA